MNKVEKYVTSIPDFWKNGIIFRDITTVIGNLEGLRASVYEMQACLYGVEFDAVVALESR